jgi:hypothetical protein
VADELLENPSDDPGETEAVAVHEGSDGSLTVEVELDDFLDDSGEQVPVPDAGDSVDPAESGDGRITYDATPWAAETRTMLTSLLEAEGVAHAWQGTEVTVLEADEEVVDRIVTEVLAAAAPALDPEAPKVVYEVSGWSAALQTELVDSLTDAAVPFEWNVDGDLVVHADDEDRVEELLDALPDDEDGGADDGLQLHEVLDRLFVAADRLGRKPSDARATVDAVESAADLGRMGLPFGFDAPAWERLVGQADGLAAALDGESAEATDDAAVAELATALRTLVSQYV